MTSIGRRFDAIANQVGKCLSHAPTAELETLSNMIDDYVMNYTRTWNGIRKQPAARKLLDVIWEHSGSAHQSTE